MFYTHHVQHLAYRMIDDVHNGFRFMVKQYIVFLILFVHVNCKAQSTSDTVKKSQSWNFHFQNTKITQYHPTFHSSYAGEKSLLSNEEINTSVTGTFFFGAKLWKGAEVYFNPEIAGGSGFSKTTGIAGFVNGEVYRVSDAAPHIYVARIFVKQIFPLTDDYQYIKDDVNQIAAKKPTSYFAISAGKFSVMDYFDNNKYSHDPRTQFYNWTLMGNGAWDYPANTRGYTYGFVFQLVKPRWAVRFSSVMLPINANGWVMDPNICRTRAEAIEFEHKYTLGIFAGTYLFVTY